MSLPPLVLASSSIGRRELLRRLGIVFVWKAPDIDETPLPDEQARDLVLRLSREKAEQVAGDHPGAVVVASDQVADLNGRIFGKPGNRDTAMGQLLAMRGKTVHFHNGLTVLALHRQTPHITTERITVTVDYRQTDEAEIGRYLDREQPWACAGSLQSEALGITMVNRIHNDDPSALIGLPLIALSRRLRSLGYPVP